MRQIGIIGMYTNCVKAAIPLPVQDFVFNLRERLRAVWRELDDTAPRTHARKMAIYHARMASPLKPSNAHLLPKYLQLELSRHVLRNIARFHLHAHTLRVGTACGQIHNSHRVTVTVTNVTCTVSRMKTCPSVMPFLGNMLLEKEIRKSIC